MLNFKRMDSNQPGAWKSSKKSGMLQPQSPKYQDNPGVYTASLHSQPVPQVAYTQVPYPGQSTVAVQPTVYVTTVAPLINPERDYLGYSIFTMMCCCFALGVAALIFSISTRRANNSGQRQEAEKNSRTARNLNHAAVGLGLLSIVLVVVTQVVVYKHAIDNKKGLLDD